MWISFSLQRCVQELVLAVKMWTALRLGIESRSELDSKCSASVIHAETPFLTVGVSLHFIKQLRIGAFGVSDHGVVITLLNHMPLIKHQN